MQKERWAREWKLNFELRSTSVSSLDSNHSSKTKKIIVYIRRARVALNIFHRVIINTKTVSQRNFVPKVQAQSKNAFHWEVTTVTELFKILVSIPHLVSVSKRTFLLASERAAITFRNSCSVALLSLKEQRFSFNLKRSVRFWPHTFALLHWLQGGTRYWAPFEVSNSDGTLSLFRCTYLLRNTSSGTFRPGTEALLWLAQHESNHIHRTSLEATVKSSTGSSVQTWFHWVAKIEDYSRQSVCEKKSNSLTEHRPLERAPDGYIAWRWCKADWT